MKLQDRAWLLGTLALGATLTGCGDDPSFGRGVDAGVDGRVPSADAAPDAMEAAPLLDGGTDPEAGSHDAAGARYQGPRFLVVVMEGLRPELVTEEAMPNLFQLQQRGVSFSQHVSVFPANSAAAAASLVTGAYPGVHGIFGSRVYLPNLKLTDAAGRTHQSSTPFDLSDAASMASIDRQLDGGLLAAPTLLQAVEAAGGGAAVIGRSGPVSLLDYRLELSAHLDEDVATPYAFASWLAALNTPTSELGVPVMPPLTSALYSEFSRLITPFIVATPGQTTLDVVPAYPDAHPPERVAKAPRTDLFGVGPGMGSADPTRVLLGSLYGTGNLYFGSAAAGLLSQPVNGADELRGDLTLYWIREPAATLHRYGPNSASTRAALSVADQLLGTVLARAAGMNVVVVSDHGFSALAGEQEVFPRYALQPPRFAFSVKAGVPIYDANGIQVGDYTAYTHWPDDNVLVPGPETGIALDGEVRLAWLLRQAAYAHAVDGADDHSGTSAGCLKSTLSSSLLASASISNNLVCIPLDAELAAQPDEDTIVIASNGGSEHLFLPKASPHLVSELVKWLQARPEIGGIFVASRYGKLPGTLPLALVQLEGSAKRQPDLVVAYAWEAQDIVNAAHQVQAPASGPGLGWGVEGCENTEGTTTSCRQGLVCMRPDYGGLSRSCLFCPDLPESERQGLSAEELELAEKGLPTCHATVDLGEVWQDRPRGTPAKENEYCDLEGLCDPGLTCLAQDPSQQDSTSARPGVCVKPGTKLSFSPLPPGLLTGTSYASMRDARGVSGGGAPAELHTVLVMAGPAFKQGAGADAPAGIVDIAPTIAHVMGLDFKAPNGRILTEALVDGEAVEAHDPEQVKADAVSVNPFDPTLATSQRKGPAVSYRTTLTTRETVAGGKVYKYIMSAGATRE